MAESAAFKRGREIRSQMFGEATTAAQIDGANAFTAPMQAVVTDYCFGQTWSQPGLSLKTRSMITLAALAALGRPHEIRIHVRGAIANGVTPTEIRDILLHTMVYAGVPLGVDAVLNAAEALREMGVDLDTLEPPAA
ncbi:MAG: carboxymuconolactone decarboxylase family protein [Burkholderiaceae bacterium]